jgi:alpha-glutamyl/putrescinyl thymine pyrophosphorylase clade 1
VSKKEKLWKTLPQVPVIRGHLDEFYQFMYERHMIWHRRFVLKQPPPWTKDPILRNCKFTNVRRDLDYGTIWYMKQVAPTATDQHDLLWLTIMYRILNRVETFEKVSLIHYKRWKHFRRQWIRKLKLLHKKESVFTSAHLTLPVGIGHQGMSKLDKYREVLDFTHERIDILYWAVKGARSLKVVWETLREIPCVGPFIAYEICCDLILNKTISFSEDDWANAGPGCRKGLRIIFPLLRTEQEFLDKMKELRDNQRLHFNRLGLDFLEINSRENLSLRSIEHSLCEFAKLWQARRGVGKHRMLFKPRDHGKSVMRFPRD